MALLFADEDFPFPVVERLRALGHDVVTTLEAGLAGVGTEDEEILSAATLVGRVVLTMNRRDFIALHSDDPTHAGIIVCMRDSDVTALAQRIDETLASVEDFAGLLQRVNRPSAS